ncbi:MAG: VWA domain-containing protein [Planctomycetes bacterium]|nr:VWA domain-containing protein [Planctomycetota bacterium]
MPTLPRIAALVLLTIVVAVSVWIQLLPDGPMRTRLEIPKAEAAPTLLAPGGSNDFVWCLDRSCSMGWSGELESLKLAVTLALNNLSPTSNFSLVAFSDGVVTFSGTLVEANPTNRANGVAWVNGLTASGTTCLIDGLGTAIGIAEQSTGSPRIVLIGDGTEGCGGPPSTSPAAVVAAIGAINPTPIPITTAYIDAGGDGLQTYQLIAATFLGTFSILPEFTTHFIRGDVNGDGMRDITDAIYLLAYGFVPGSPPPPCTDAADTNDNGVVEALTDAIVLLQTLFVVGSPPLPAPSIGCGPDPTSDGLTCIGLCP